MSFIDLKNRGENAQEYLEYTFKRAVAFFADENVVASIIDRPRIKKLVVNDAKEGDLLLLFGLRDGIKQHGLSAVVTLDGRTIKLIVRY